jgi:hypothetical protein
VPSRHFPELDCRHIRSAKIRLRGEDIQAIAGSLSY